MDKISFRINGKRYTVSGGDHSATTSLNDFIREVADLRGTKFMCQEGGCGSCVVQVRAPNPDSGVVEIFSVNSCLVSIFSCEGWEVTTIEAVSNRKDGYHIVSKRLNNFFGSQCGYCSPGFVMSMYSLLSKSGNNLSAEEIENSFGSNICRCTGYRPILEAFKTLASDGGDPTLLKKIKDIEDLSEVDCKSSKNGCKGSCRKNSCEDKSWCIIGDRAATAKDEDAKKLQLADGRLWYTANSIASVFQILQENGDDNYMLVAGNTAKGARPIKHLPHLIIDISRIAELRTHYMDVNLVLGANITLTETKELFQDLAKKNADFQYLEILCKHLDRVAHIPVRNIGTLAGNLVLKHEHPDFQSDVFILLECVGASLTIVDRTLKENEITLTEFMNTNIVGKIITEIKLPPLSENYEIVTYKVAPKEQNAHAEVNSAFLYKINPESHIIEESRLIFGGINPKFIHAYNTETFIKNRYLFDNSTLQKALKCLENEIHADFDPVEPSPCYRNKTAVALFYKSILKICPESLLNERYISGYSITDRPPLSHSYQEYDTDEKDFPLTQPLLKKEGLIQCSGEATYCGDEPTKNCEVFASFVLAQVALAHIDSIDASEALAVDGVIAVFKASDIPGTNSMVKLGDAFSTELEQLLASDRVKYYNQPIAIVVAVTQKLADEASYLVHAKYTNIKHETVLTIEEALKAPKEENRVMSYPPILPINRGTDIYKIIKGTFKGPQQYHHMMELYTCITTPKDDRLYINVSTQFKDSVQRAVSALLDMNESQIIVETLRCGGGFGAKLLRSNYATCATALVAKLLNKQCRMSMHLRDGTRAIGKRPDAMLQYEVAVNKNGKIQYLDSKFYINDGNTHNENENLVVVNSLQNNCYDPSTWKVESYAVITDIPSNCAMRGPGNFEAIAAIEHVMDHIALAIDKDHVEVRVANYRTVNNALFVLLPLFKKKTEYEERQKHIQTFNEHNRWKKRALHLVNMRYGALYLGNFSALVSVYHGDGTVIINGGGVEIGQGINTRLAQVAAKKFGISVEKVTVLSGTNYTNPNNFGTQSSITTECVAYTVIRCCDQINARLAPVRATMPGASWEEIVFAADNLGILLQANYQTSDKDPVLVSNYPVYGISSLEVEIDVLTGRYWIVRADVYEDAGKSINPALDMGQVEGAFIQALSLWTMEKVIHDPHTGETLTDRTWNYHVMGAKDIPNDFRVYLRRKAYNPVGVLGSKCVGEPPGCMGFVFTGAVRDAILASRHDSGYEKCYICIDYPVTSEEVVKAAEVHREEYLLH